MAGHFLTFEGIEGSGKSTQLERLARRLAGIGRVPVLTREPGGTELGRALRAWLLGVDGPAPVPEAELFLFLADRAQNVGTVIRPALRRDEIVLCDRHADATLVYQGVARGLGLETTRELNRRATGGLVPDRTLLFDLDPEVGLARVVDRRRAGGDADRLDSEATEFHHAVRDAYVRLAIQEPERIVVIDASGSADVVEARMLAAVGPWLRARGLDLPEAP